MVFFVLILFVAFTVFTLLFNSFVSYTNSVNSANHHALANQQTSLSLSGFNFGTQSPSTAGTATHILYPRVAITLTNSQTSATPNPFQQEVTWNPSTYSTNESTTLGNIRFCVDVACNTMLYAWLESCSPTCSNAATLATAWVRLTSSIAPSGTLTIYMVFFPVSTNFDAIFWGEAPTLSGTYGQYDNGANVFNVYDNFASALAAGWTQRNSHGSISPGSGVTFSMTKSGGYAYIIWSTFLTYPQVAETYVTAVGAGTDPIIGVATTLNINGYSAFYNGVSMDWLQGTTTARLVSQTSAGGTTVGTATVSATFTPGIWGVTWSATNAESGTAQGGTATGTTSSAIANYAIYIGESGNGGGTGTDSMSWARMRSDPPNNVMPGESLGPLIPSGSSATSYSFERKLVYSQSLWWAFFSDGTNMVLETSADGSIWSNATIISTSSATTSGYDFSIWQSGNTIYYVLADSGASNSFLWRYGTMLSSGSITWSIPETTVTTTNRVYSFNSIVTDASGNVWVALNTNDGTNTHISVWKYAGGSWSKVDDVSPVATDTVPILVPISGGVALIYGSGGTTQTVKVTASATGSIWSTAVSPASYYKMDYSSATSIGNTLYFVGLASASTGAVSGTVKFWSFTFGAGQTSPETQLNATVSPWLTSISEEASRTLIVFYGSGSNIYDLYSVNAGATWYPRTTISSTESSITGLTSIYAGTGVIWTSGTAVPFNVRFADLPSVTISNNSPFPVHMISLYIYNPNTNAVVHFDTNTSATGVTGSFDYWLGAGETVSVPLPSYTWVTSQSYLVTATTDQGVVSSLSTTAPA